MKLQEKDVFSRQEAVAKKPTDDQKRRKKRYNGKVGNGDKRREKSAFSNRGRRRSRQWRHAKAGERVKLTRIRGSGHMKRLT